VLKKLKIDVLFNETWERPKPRTEPISVFISLMDVVSRVKNVLFTIEFLQKKMIFQSL